MELDHLKKYNTKKKKQYIYGIFRVQDLSILLYTLGYIKGIITCGRLKWKCNSEHPCVKLATQGLLNG